MNFRHVSRTESISECGLYCRTATYHEAAKKEFFNAWLIETNEHVAAGFAAQEISDRCDEHKARQG